MMQIEKAIDRLGGELLECADNCGGIQQDRNSGVLPRSLFLERSNAPGRGCLAVGLNPGTSRPAERSFFCTNGTTYEQIKAYRLRINDIPYFRRTRQVIDQLGLSGPILWSNLAKCENEVGRKELPPLQTFRHCTSKYLRRELKAVPSEWVILGIGWEAFRALAYLVPERAIIGIPHPTGGFRDFRKLLAKGLLLENLKEHAKHATRSCDPEAVWLGEGKHGAEQNTQPDARKSCAPVSSPLGSGMQW
jgi:hypothetical protein